MQRNTGRSGWTNTIMTFVHRRYDLEVSVSYTDVMILKCLYRTQTL